MKLWRKSAIIDFVHKFDVAIVTFNKLLKMAVPNKQLNNTDIDKVRQKISALYQCILNVPLWNDWRKVRYSKVHWFSGAKSTFITKFPVNLCDKIRRTHTVLARSKMYPKQNLPQKKLSVSLDNDLIFRFRLYFSARFAFYFLV